MSAASEAYSRWRYRLLPDHVIGELLAKSWIDNAIPVLMLAVVVGVFSLIIPDLFTTADWGDFARQYAELVLVALGMTLVMLAGGIDLSVGSNFALANITALGLMNLLNWPFWAMVPVVLAISGLVGLLNGILVGYLRLRAFLTTLVTLIFVRAIVDLLLLKYSVPISLGAPTDAVWQFVSFESLWGVPVSFVCAAVLAVAMHVFLSRMRLGWHLLAVGGSRRSAHNIGIPVRRIVCMTYVLSGILAGLSGIFYAARLGSAGNDAGLGLEVLVLTAVVLGGNSIGGGRGSVAKALLGAVVVLFLNNSLIRLGLKSGATPMVLGLVLLLAVAVDVRWLKNRHKVLSRVYVSPTYFALPALVDTAADSGTAYALNDKLRGVELIGLGQVEGPEDIIFDRADNLYCGSRHGDIIRFFAPDYKHWEVFTHIGGQPLGFGMDRDENLLICVAGMGLYAIAPDRSTRRLSDETNRSWLSVVDDSRLRLADDLDIAPDGRVFFSEATIRYEMFDWPVDALEARGNGRIICYDPRDGSSRTVIPKLQFPNGICMAADGESFFFAETWGCRINRHWFAGPKAGRSEVVLPDLPGYPDNINRASDGNFWCALVGMRSPAFDLAMRMPSFRRRMAQRVAPDEWMYPNMNTGCVIKFSPDGRVLESLWDLGGENHPMLTSMREHKGWLYLGGIHNNRIGRYRIPGADPTWTSQDSYWGARA